MRERRQVHGILLLDKPLEISSNGALQRVKRLFNAKKAGHTGSLDPLATGMLPLCFGEATKFSQFLLDADKAYRVVAKLGIRTTTGDAEGTPIEVLSAAHITVDDITKQISHFIGEMDQVPPMFSAIKVQGRPLYELARQGIDVERKSRRITIFDLVFEGLQGDEATFHVRCSKGTYIRTLVEDMGKALGCGAHVAQLRRTMVMPYGNGKMYTLSDLEHIAQTSGHEGLTACLLPVESAIQVFPVVRLSTSASFYIRMGQPVRATAPQHSSLVRLVSEDAKFIGIGEVSSDGFIKPHRLLAVADIPAMPT